MTIEGTPQGNGHHAGNGASRPTASVPVPRGRVPPHDLVAERKLLGGVLLEGSGVPNRGLRDASEVVQPFEFYREAHRHVFEVMLQLDEDREPIDVVTVCNRLRERGLLDVVGGQREIELLDSEMPSASSLKFYAQIVHEKSLARRLIEAAQAIVTQGYEGAHAVDALLDDADRRLRAITDKGEARHHLLGKAMVISPMSIRADLPRREYLLTRTADGVGVVASAKAAMLAASGGSGKSYAVMQLAVAIATGGTWLGSWAAKQGRAMLILGEEDADEANRRLHYVCKAIAPLSDEELEQISANLTLMPMAGRSVGLTTTEVLGGGLPRSRFAIELHELLVAAKEEGRPYTWLGLDPLSRFAGPDVEVDNAAATAFVQIVESFSAAETGSPSVLLTHHLRKKGLLDGKGGGASPIRGSSALVDGVRWAGLLERVDTREGQPGLMRLSVVKTNYAPEPPPLILERAPDCHGALRLAKGMVEHEENVAQVEVVSDEIIEKIFAKLPKEGEGVSKAYLINVAKVNKQAGLQAVDLLVDAGRAQKVARGRYLAASVPAVPDGSGEESGTKDRVGSQASLLPLKGGEAEGTKSKGGGTKKNPEPKSGTKPSGDTDGA